MSEAVVFGELSWKKKCALPSHGRRRALLRVAVLAPATAAHPQRCAWGAAKQQTPAAPQPCSASISPPPPSQLFSAFALTVAMLIVMKYLYPATFIAMIAVSSATAAGEGSGGEAGMHGGRVHQTRLATCLP